MLADAESGSDSSLFRPSVAKLDSAISWLSDRGISAGRLASAFQTNANHIRQLVRRGRHGDQKDRVSRWLTEPLNRPRDPFAPPAAQLRQRIGLRKEEDGVILYFRDRRNLSNLEEAINQLGEEFWNGVRFGSGLRTIRRLRQQMGFVAYVPRMRLRARLEHLLAETNLHIGKSASALSIGLTALHIWRTAWAQSEDPNDLKEIARTALLLSQAHLLRLEPEQASGYLLLHEQASIRAGAKPGAEFHRQTAVVQFQNEDWSAAHVSFKRAAETLSDTVEYGRQKKLYEVLNIGKRQLNLLDPVDWDGAQELLAYMESCLPPGDIHRSMNLNWTVACGFATDSPGAQLRAQELIEGQPSLSDGFGHQATVSRLLAITPILPGKLRASWVRHALYENALRNS